MTRLIALILLLIAAPVGADDKEKSAQELMTASGLDRQIAQIPAGILLGLEQQKGALPEEIHNGLRDAMSRAYSAKFIETKVASAIRDRLDEKVMAETLVWLQSDLGKKITALEGEASSPEGYLAIQDYAQQLQRNPPPPNRLKLAQEMDEATSATDVAVSVIEAGELGVALGLDSLRPADEQLGLDKLMENISQERGSLTAGMRDLNIVGFLYMYRTLSDEELDSYLKFLQSDPGVKYQEAVTAGLKEALLEAAVETARALPETIKGSAGGMRA
ncbi:MAG: DUF2059 domain-containing protein [Burkholderiales bacterium]